MSIRSILSVIALVMIAAMPRTPAEPAAPAPAVPAPAIPAKAARGPAVTIEHFEFKPGTLTVSGGTTVTWINHDEETHTATSKTGAFASPGLDADETFAYRFTRPGTYTYFCALHPKMTATIVVK